VVGPVSHLATLAGISRQSSAAGQPALLTPPLGTWAAHFCGMMTILFIALALTTAGFVTELIAATHAPFDYEDEAGFHFGTDTSGNPAGLENPS